jgi:branched-chain amino acid transport system permease protein
VALTAAGAIFLILLPLLLDKQDMYFRVLGMAFFYGALAFSWNLYSLTGVISLGHAAFFGLGAYGAALSSHYWHLSPYGAILLGGVLGAFYGLLWGIAFKRLRGATLALATLASVEIPKVIIDNWDSFTFGSLGVVGIPNLPTLHLGRWVVAFGQNLEAQYYLLLCFLFIVGLIHRKAVTSRWGWAIRAVREDETAAGAMGVNVWGTRFRVLLLSAFLTALCGGLYAHLIGLIEPALVFSLHISALPLVLSIFGGRYQSLGPLLGALILYPLDQLILHAWLPAGHAAVYGLVVILTLLFFPHGIGAWLQERAKFV